MATVNFSVPDEIKDEFNRTFEHQNKSALIARLMQQAVEAQRRQERRKQAVARLLKLRSSGTPATKSAVRSARSKGRP